MPRFSNSFNAGTDGTDITVANSGSSGDPFDNVQASGGSTITYNAANAQNGAMAAAIDPFPSVVAYVSYHLSPDVTDVYGRVYVKFPTLPADLVALVTMRDDTTLATRARFIVQTDGLIRFSDASGTTVATSTSALVAGSYARLEWHWVGDPTVGVLELKTFLNPNSTTPSSTTTATGLNTGGGADRLRIGQTTAQPTDITTFYVDEVTWDTAGYIGPVPFPPVVPALLNQSGVLFTPKANRTITVPLIDQSPTANFPTLRRGVNVGFINQSGVLFAFGERLSVGSSSAFQFDAFQTNAFQSGRVFFVDASPVLFTPKVNETVTVPGPTNTGSFQSDAFQTDAFQASTGAGGIDSSGVVYAPEVVVSPPGVLSVIPGIIQGAGSLFTPLVGANKVDLTLLDASGVLFAPQENLQVKFSFSTGVYDSPEIIWDDPDVHWDGSGSGGFINQSGQVFNPATFGKGVQPALLDVSGVLFAPSMGAKFVTVGFINAAPAVFNITFVGNGVSLELLDASPQVFGFAFPFTPTFDLLDASPEVFAPSVDPEEIDVPLIDASGFLMNISIAEKVTVPLLDASGVVFAPFTGKLVFAPSIDGSPTVFTPSLERVLPPLIDGSGVVFEPQRTNIPFAQFVSLDSNPAQFLIVSPVVFAPSSLAAAQPLTIVIELLDASGQVFSHRVFTPTRPTIVLHARYDPVSVKHARHDPVILKHAQNTRQG